MRSRLLRVSIAAACFTASAARTEAQTAVLGADGDLYRVRAGAYGELFPEGTEADTATPVLALEVVASSATRRVLVPETAGPEVEQAASVVFEPASRSAYVVWESRINHIHPILNLASFDGAAWSEVIEVTGNPYASKSSPRLAVTRDAYELPAGEGTVSHQRTVVHLSWGEETSGRVETYYTPLILEDGAFIGWNQLYSLGSLKTLAGGAESPDFFASPYYALTLQPGSDGRTVIAAFSDPSSGRLLTVEITLVPGEMVWLGDEARAHIIHGGAEKAADVEALADGARAHIIHAGARLNPAVVKHLADEARAHIIHSGIGKGGDLQALADGARAHIIHAGATLLGAERLFSGQAATRVLELAGLQGSHAFAVRALADFAAPLLGSPSPDLYASADGRAAIAAWRDGQLVRYRETAGEKWTQIRTLELGESLTLEQVERVLLDRLNQR